MARPAPKLNATSAERFDARRGSGAASGTMGAAAGDAEPFTYTLPAGWQKASPVQFRDVNLSAPDGVECWVSLLPPSSTALSHLARWCGQLGLPEPDEGAVAGLAKLRLLGKEALRIDLTAKDGKKRLLGSMLLAPERHVFVRMQGTPEAVAAQEAALVAFEASLADRTAGSANPGVGSAPSPSNDDAEPQIRWSTPAGWTAQGPATMRLETFDLGGGVSCWLTLLRGDGGGLVANVQRWAGQVGLPMLSTAELAALPRWDVRGHQAAYVALLKDGDAEGLLAISVPLDGWSLYVRMRGPSSALRSHEAEFRTFCLALDLEN